MAHAFKIIPAKPTLGSLRTNALSFQSDYITLKKSKLVYCNSFYNCGKTKNMSNYNQMNLFNNGQRNSFNYLAKNHLVPFNKSNLVAGLYSKMNLENVCTLINGFPCNNIDTCAACKTAVSVNSGSANPLNWSNTIDPVGALFGNTQCGIQNFTNYSTLGC